MTQCGILCCPSTANLGLGRCTGNLLKGQGCSSFLSMFFTGSPPKSQWSTSSIGLELETWPNLEIGIGQSAKFISYSFTMCLHFWVSLLRNSLSLYSETFNVLLSVSS